MEGFCGRGGFSLHGTAAENIVRSFPPGGCHWWKCVQGLLGLHFVGALRCWDD